MDDWLKVATNTSRLFGWLLLVEWLVAAGGSLTSLQAEDAGHGWGHICVAFGVGGVLVATSVYLSFRHSTWQVTWYVVAVTQICIGSILSHTLSGWEDIPLHVFGSLALISLYRDWRLLLTGSLVVLADQMILEPIWPLRDATAQDVDWSPVERIPWVLFAVVFLFLSIWQSVRDRRASVQRLAQLELSNEAVEKMVETRTAELAASERRFRALIEQASDSFFVTDLGGQIVDLNQQACESLDFTREELLGKKFGEIDIDFQPEHLEAILRGQQGGRPATMYGRQRRSDGGIIHTEVRPRMIEIGGQQFVLFIVRDITERKRDEAELREREERYRLLFESNPHPMWVFAPMTYQFLAVNDAAVTHYGYSRERFSRMTIADLEPPGPDGLPDPHEAAPIPGQLNHPRSHRLANGEVRQMELAAHPIEFDCLYATLVLAIDVTERKRLEEQLKQAQKLESIGQLAAGVAHEINTPIQYIGDNAAFINDAFRDLSTVLQAFRTAGTDPTVVSQAQNQADAADLDYLLAETPRAIEQTRDGVQQVARIVKAMKEFAHPGSAEKSAVDLNKALETVITVARNEWKYVADVRTDFDPRLPLIQGLPGELNQVFLNLLVNAAQAITAAGSRDRRGRITISTRTTGNVVEVRVSDNGCGIPEHARGRVFDPFFTTKPVGQGTGQGLAIAHNVVVNMHSGSITFDTTAGEGTSFIVRLPADGTRLSRCEQVPDSPQVRPLAELYEVAS